MSDQKTDLALHTTVTQLCAAFEAAERDVRAAFAQIVSAEKAVNAAFGNAAERFPAIRVSACGSRYHDNFTDADEAIEVMTRAAWKAIVDRLELRRFMSIRAYEEMTQHLDREELPPITVETVMRFAHDHLAQARQYLKAAVDEVFEFLRPHKYTKAGQLKTNTELEIRERVILPSVIELGWGRNPFRVNSYRRQHLIALENVFTGLAGQGEINKGWQSALETAIEQSEDGKGQTDLFEFSAHKNGHLHLRFRRLDLLEKFNRLAGGTRLRPAETEEDRLRREIAAEKAKNERLKRERAA